MDEYIPDLNDPAEVMETSMLPITSKTWRRYRQTSPFKQTRTTIKKDVPPEPRQPYSHPPHAHTTTPCSRGLDFWRFLLADPHGCQPSPFVVRFFQSCASVVAVVSPRFALLDGEKSTNEKERKREKKGRALRKGYRHSWCKLRGPLTHFP